MESFESTFDHPLNTLVALPIELLVYIISFLTSTRDKVKLRYVSRELRAAVETPLLWRDFTWPHFDFRERRSIRSVMKLCGRHVRRLSFPDHVVHESFKHCSNVLQLSLPSVRLSVNQLRIILQSMKKLQYLDILWVIKNDVKLLLLMVGYPVYGRTIKELTIREQVRDCSLQEVPVFLLNEWAASKLAPQTINVVCRNWNNDLVNQWWISFKNSTSQPGNHIGHLNIYGTYSAMAGFVPTCPMVHIEISLMPSYGISLIAAQNYGFPGSECMWLTKRSTGNGHVIYQGRIIEKIDTVYGTPKNIENIAFLTHFNAARYHRLFSEHLETLAVACPNLQQLNLQSNVNCLKCLQGLRAIATHCKNLEGLNILGIPVQKLESSIKLWEILVDFELVYLAIELCCLLWFDGDNNNKAIIVNLHQQCVKLKALQSHRSKCTECKETKELLSISSFPLLIQCCTNNIENVILHDKLKYLWYIGHRRCYWEVSSCSLEHVFIFSKSLELPDSSMVSMSAHGGLVHVILLVKSVTLTGIEALIGNSPSLITFHIYYAGGLCMPREFNLKLKKRYAHRKLFLCGSFCFIRDDVRVFSELDDMFVWRNMNFVTVWPHSA